MRRLWIAIAIFCAIFIVLQTYRWRIWTFGADTGTFSQIVLDAFGGFRDGPEQGTHFRFHWAPLLAVLYPVVALTRSGLALQFSQFVLIAFTAVPIYALARRYTDERTAVWCGILPLIYPPLVAVAFGEFHEIAFYPLVACALIWALDAERWVLFAVLAIASALVREECCIAFIVVGLGLTLTGTWHMRMKGAGSGLLFFEPRNPRALAAAGMFLFLLNAGALAVYFLVVIPRVGAWQPAHFYDYPFAYG
ncbi:MAG: DUF2079 domain-containing protein, partial [Candidatus Eremiobacteraeota bacterium]|nr:DUF2079 domain-containing protein [Candidatus Eremiobacteraeota bacterium]